MRTITAKYAGDCRKCGATIPEGEPAVYERRVGIFCPDCAPTDPEEIREYRQEGADRKADKYQDWAEKRRTKAAALEARNEPFVHDWAFITQPGRIPERERANRRSAKAHEHMTVAEGFERKAHGLRKVRVAGDAETIRQTKRETVLGWLKVGMEVDTVGVGTGKGLKINRKTAKVGSLGVSGTWTQNVELSFLRQIASAEQPSRNA